MKRFLLAIAALVTLFVLAVPILHFWLNGTFER